MDQPFSLRRGFKLRGDGLPEQAHDEAQLTFAASGSVQVHTDEGRWLAPPQLAVWIPAGVRHRVEVLTDVELCAVHWCGSAVRAWAPAAPLARAFALRVTPLLRALLAAAFAGDATPEKVELLLRLMLHELNDCTDAPTFLPWPASPAAQRVAELALDDLRQALNLAEITARAATSVRTASRLFPAETGLTFKAWRQRARIVQAMDRLGRGRPIAQVSAEAGFASTAAFSCAFRQVTAMTPTAFVGAQGAVTASRPADGSTRRALTRAAA